PRGHLPDPSGCSAWASCRDAQEDRVWISARCFSVSTGDSICDVRKSCQPAVESELQPSRKILRGFFNLVLKPAGPRRDRQARRGIAQPAGYAQTSGRDRTAQPRIAPFITE